jgi:hypothetical protein
MKNYESNAELILFDYLSSSFSPDAMDLQLSIFLAHSYSFLMACSHFLKTRFMRVLQCY